MSASTGATSAKKPVSVVHSLADFGLLHAGTLPDDALNQLRLVCGRTPCDSIHTNVAQLFDRQTMDLLQQGCHGHQTALLKLPDGYMLVAPQLNHRVLSVIKDAVMCLPASCHPSEAQPLTADGARTDLTTGQII